MTNNQQLAAHCRDVIANPQDHLDWVVDMAKVALASVEAEPVAWTDEEELRDANKCGVGYLFKNVGDDDRFADPRRQLMLYTSPPVAVMQPVVLPQRLSPCRSGYGYSLLADDNGDAYDCVQVIDAIRAAGGSVKE
ncbi:hypothetical protein [Pantoea sp. RIT-PI-b]|uniref:hypothetical protein n=1 Tax=Pantoea sp. RIT-PI-b TaxID=1681195 RepID=UPI0006761F4E|nr:hypothetical protein [Pantoea sp. RIT-PI-b]